MKTLGVWLASRVWMILLFFASTGLCQIHCQWGSFGEWSACDPCTKLQSRSRPMVVFAQFGGNPCGGVASQKSQCETTQHCPLGDGCRNRFRCLSGRCISLSLVCNGDQDCEEDSLDEGTCDIKHASCNSAQQPPPNIEKLGLGFDVVTGEERGSVMNTKSFGAQCRIIDGVAFNSAYRIPLSTLSYKYMVKVQKEFKEELFTSHWEYAKSDIFRQTVTGTTTGFHNKDSYASRTEDKRTHMLILKSSVELATFQNQAARQIPISEAFWAALSGLPTVYDYAAYLEVVKQFGTHYRSEGSMGGSMKAIMYISLDRFQALDGSSFNFNECNKPKEYALFIPFSREKCNKDGGYTSIPTSGKKDSPLVLRTEVIGGLKTAGLYHLDLTNPAKNWKAYTDWADSITSSPEVTKQKLRPLHELVKEVSCAGLKRLHLRAAIQQYEAQTHPCHCRPCHNNGLAVRQDAVCNCICKPGTSGLACGTGTELEGQPGVVHGSWSCWSQWSSCSGTRRSRSRVCSNPRPRNGGLHCTGEPSEMSECEDQELEYLRTMEPECFDVSATPKKKCGIPPVLINGFVSDPKDLYLVGGNVEYRCIHEFHLVGPSVITCMEDETWSQRPGQCLASKCQPAVLADGVIASPLKGLYSIGEKVTLSCPPGRQIEGQAEVICDPSLHFSPSPQLVTCSEVTISTPAPPAAQCKPGEKLSRGQCVCRFPYECLPSLEVCAALPQRPPALLSVCKLHALQCLGKGHSLLEHSACQWPVMATAASCDSCHIWEVCDAQTNACRCKEASECPAGDGLLCARAGADGDELGVTMGECEAGRRRCNGENVTVLSLKPCPTL